MNSHQFPKRILHACKTYDSLCEDKTLPESNLEQLQQVLHTPPDDSNTRDLPQHQAEAFKDVMTCSQADRQRLPWGSLLKSEKEERKKLNRLFQQKRAAKRSKSLRRLFATQQKKPTRS